jgi:CubicO group peptidase (beta-lactamase class C family)
MGGITAATRVWLWPGFILISVGFAFGFSVPAGLRADESVDETMELRGVTALELQEFLGEQPAAGRIVQKLSTRLSRGSQVFDVSVEENTIKSAWLVHINLSRAEFEEKNREYQQDGYKVLCQQGLNTGRQRLYLAVWVQGSGNERNLVMPTGELPSQGEHGRDLAPLNDLMVSVLQNGNLPGAVVAVAQNDELIYERAFGYADVDRLELMTTSSVMRVASLSKPMTAAAILMLVQEGQLSLKAPLLPLLEKHPEHFDTTAAVERDARWSSITIEQLLQHTAGFDRDLSGDTMFEVVKITRELRLSETAKIPDVIRYQLSRPLDFAPGERFCYSNVGYSFLGRVIEAVSGDSYGEFVKRRILQPAGMHSTRLGRTALSGRAADEAHYFTQIRRSTPLVTQIATGRPSRDIQMVETPYGQWDLELMDSHGGWTSTAGDMVRFLMALESPSAVLLKRAGVSGMQVKPEIAGAGVDDVWYGHGWNIRALPGRSGSNYWHTGLLPGTSTLLVRRWDGCSWAVLFNCDRTDDDRLGADVIDGPMHKAVTESLQRLSQSR